MTAIISPCTKYRYRLERSGAAPGRTCIVMLNPSTADTTTNDHTIRKLMRFGYIHQWGTLLIGNLYALRSTDPKALSLHPDPTGPDNLEHLTAMMAQADRVLFAWGALSKQPPQLRDVQWPVCHGLALAQGHQPLCIGAPLQDGHPRHPLMAAYRLPIREWNPPLDNQSAK